MSAIVPVRLPPGPAGLRRRRAGGHRAGPRACSCRRSGAPSPSASVAAVASATPIATPAPTPSPTPAPGLPGDPHRRRGHRRRARRRTPEDRLADPGGRPRPCSRSVPAIGSSPTDDSSDYPAEAKALPDVVTFGTVDVEKIVSLAPDLVIAGGAGFTSADAIAQLRDAQDPGARRVDPVDRRHLQGHRARRRRPSASPTRPPRSRPRCAPTCRRSPTAAKADRRRPTTKPRVFYDVGYIDTTGQIYGPAEGSFLAEMVGLARGRRDHRRRADLRDPAREAHRARSAGDHPGRQRVLHADGRDDRQADPAGRC